MKALRVLLVEDDALIGMLLAEMLEGMGHDVGPIATTEAEAVTTAARYRPELMIVDGRLRDGSGVSFVEEILRTEAVPYIFISGAMLDGCRPDALVLQKPFAEEELVRAIQSVIGTPTPSEPPPGG